MTETIKLGLEEFRALSWGDSEEFDVIAEIDHGGDKYMTTQIVVRRLSDDKLFTGDLVKSGSYFTDWDYSATDPTLTECHETVNVETIYVVGPEDSPQKGWFTMAEDDDGHMYVIPVEKAEEFFELDQKGKLDEADWANPIGGSPLLVTFPHYEME